MTQNHPDIAVVCFEFHLPPKERAKTKIEREYPNEKGALFLYVQTSASHSALESASLTPEGAADAHIRFSKMILNAGLCPAGGFGEPRWELAEEGLSWMSLESPWNAGGETGWASGLAVPFPVAAEVRAFTVNLGVIDFRHDPQRALRVMDGFIKSEFQGQAMVSPLEAIEMSQAFHQKSNGSLSLGVDYQIAFAQQLPGLLAARRELGELSAAVAPASSAPEAGTLKKASPPATRL